MTPEAQILCDLAAQPQIRQVAAVLGDLEARGIASPAVASGYIRTQLLGTSPSDIDIHYVGAIPTATAERWLAEILAARGLTGEWDIWNFSEHDPGIASVEAGYLTHFVSTIDCIYLKSDGVLYDLTDRGAADVLSRTLALTHLAVKDYPYTPGQLCYLLLEGCRRMFLYGLTPEPASAEAIRAGAVLWHECAPADRRYLWERLRQKLTPAQREMARPLYATFGWDAIFTEDAIFADEV